MNISIDIEPRAWTRKLGGIAEKISNKRKRLYDKYNVRYCKLRVRLAKK